LDLFSQGFRLLTYEDHKNYSNSALIFAYKVAQIGGLINQKEATFFIGARINHDQLQNHLWHDNTVHEEVRYDLKRGEFNTQRVNISGEIFSSLA